MAMYCGICSSKDKKDIKLVNGVCPVCKADYAATMDVFNVQMPKRTKE